MSVWGWVLVGLVVAGAILALVALVQVALAALRLNKHANALMDSSLFLSLDSLQIQSARLSQLSAQIPPLQARAETALATIREFPQAAGMPEATSALRSAGAEIALLIEDLR